MRGQRKRSQSAEMLSLKPITAFLILACLLAGFNGYAQQQHITLSYKDAPLKNIFSAIEKQTGYVFFKNRLLMQNAKKVTITVKDASLEETLQLCFRDQPFSYFVYSEAALFNVPCGVFSAWACPHVITVLPFSCSISVLCHCIPSCKYME